MLKNIYEKVIVFGAFFVMAACAHQLIMSEITPGSGVTPAFQALLDKFNGLAEQHIPGYCQPPIDVGYGNLKNLDASREDKNTTIGVCIPTPRPMILFDRGFWERSTPTEKEMVAFHEFGHCILDLDHNTTMMGDEKNKEEASLMAPVIFSEYQYLQMYDYYIREMFAASTITEDEWKEACDGEDKR